MPRTPIAATVALFLSFAAGCTPSPAPDAAESADELATSYGDFGSVLGAEDYDRWFSVRAALQNGFDQICGDTFCSGDYSNLTTVRVECSATSVMRKMKDCVWVLGGSISYVNPVTGAISIEDRTFACKIPVASTAKTMLDALTAAGPNALHTVLPGTTTSFYDAIGTCLSGVVGNAPPAPAAGPFVSMSDFLLNGGGDWQAWNDTTRNLAARFDDVCGDSFCEGEYSDIVSLGFTCAVDAAANKVRTCTWTFAEANTSVGDKGLISTDAATKSCSVALYVNPSTLTKALAVEDPLRARLPGKTTSLYDSLISCL